MNEGRTVFAQLMDLAPKDAFRRCIRRYNGDHRTRSFSCWDQFLTMSFAQLTYRESLRDIEACLRAVPERLYHVGIRGRVSRSTLADANERRDWRIYADFAQILIHEARRLYADQPLALELDETIYALDSTTIDLCMSLFPWAYRQQSKSAVKLHTLLDLRGNIPTFLWLTGGKVHDVRVLDVLIPEPGSIYVLDRGYTDFRRLFLVHQLLATFVIRAKKNLHVSRLYSHPVDRSTGLICDQTVRLARPQSHRQYPDLLRRIRYNDREGGHKLTFLTNNFLLPALTVAELYRMRWQIELFFRWLKQHLRIKRFYGVSPNAVKTQIWIAISVYVLVAILKKRLGIERDLYTILQVLSLTLFEKTPVPQLLTSPAHRLDTADTSNQLLLFDL